MSILRIDTSVSLSNSVSRDLTDRILSAMGDTAVVTRDLAQTPLPHITDDWATARLVSPEDRNATQNAVLELSDHLIAEIKAADTIVIGLPIYNFSVPASLKAWIDLVARPGETFQYTADGPQGLITGKRVILAVASGGTPVGSAADFATGFMRHVLAFIGLTDVEVVAADAMATAPERTLSLAHAQIESLRTAA